MAEEANRYDRETHDDYIICPRCSSRNAPAESDDFEPTCWDCNEHLGYQPVSAGDVVELDVTDIHESGAGVGHTEDGFVVLVDGILPEKRIKAEVKVVHEKHAKGEHLETIATEIPEETDEEDPQDETEASQSEAVDESQQENFKREQDERDERLGSRDNWWGGSK